MANTTLNMTLLLRRAEFADSCVLQAGEPGYHITTKEFKVGDGTTTWKELPIANKTQIEAIVTAAIAAHAAGYYTKSEIDDIKLALQNATSGVATDLAAEVTARTEADNALDSRLDTVEAKLNNVSNVMDFVGARTVTISAEGVISVTANEGETFNKGDVVVATSGDHAGKEFVFDGTTWHEFGYADGNTASINNLKERMEAAEDDIGENTSAIAALGTAKLDVSAFNAFNNGTSKTVSAIEADIVSKANAAKADAISTVVGTADDGAETDTIKGVRKAFDAADAATLTAAKAYADEKVAGAVTKVSAGNADIVVTPESGTGNVTVAHKTYGTGTYTKPDSVNDANFVTGVTIENGHVTGASVKSLAEALSAMTFIFDGGTSAT